MAHPIQNSELADAVRTTLPNLLGIGAAKAGTTWFADVLSRHPDVFVPPQKELNCLHYDDLDDRLEEYAAYFRGAEDARVRCDFSVRYLSSKNAPSAAARLIPEAKILAILRNPVDQVQSNYWHLRRQNFSQKRAVRPIPDLFEALAEFPELLYEPARYHKHLSTWISLFPADQILVLRYEDVTRALPETLSQLWRFLGLNEPVDILKSPAGPTRDGRQGVSLRDGVLGKIYPNLYTAVAHGPYQWLKQNIGVQATESFKRAFRLRQVSEAIFFRTGYPKLSAPEREKLFDIFSDDIDALESSKILDTGLWRGR